MGHTARDLSAHVAENGYVTEHLRRGQIEPKNRNKNRRHHGPSADTGHSRENADEKNQQATNGVARRAALKERGLVAAGGKGVATRSALGS